MSTTSTTTTTTDSSSLTKSDATNVASSSFTYAVKTGVSSIGNIDKIVDTWYPHSGFVFSSDPYSDFKKFLKCNFKEINKIIIEEELHTKQWYTTSLNRFKQTHKPSSKTYGGLISFSDVPFDNVFIAVLFFCLRGLGRRFVMVGDRVVRLGVFDKDHKLIFSTRDKVDDHLYGEYGVASEGLTFNSFANFMVFDEVSVEDMEIYLYLEGYPEHEKYTLCSSYVDDMKQCIPQKAHYKAFEKMRLPDLIYDNDRETFVFLDLGDVEDYNTGTVKNVPCFLAPSNLTCSCFHICCAAGTKVPTGVSADSRFAAVDKGYTDFDKVKAQANDESTFKAVIKGIGSVMSGSRAMLSSVVEAIKSGATSTVDGVRNLVRKQVLAKFMSEYGLAIATMLVDLIAVFAIWYISRDYKLVLISLTPLVLHWGVEYYARDKIAEMLTEGIEAEHSHTLNSPLMMMGIMASLLVARVLGNYDMINYSSIAAIVGALSVSAIVSNNISDLIDYFGSTFLPESASKFIASSLPYSACAGYYHVKRCQEYEKLTPTDQLDKKKKADFIASYEALEKCVSSTASSISFINRSLSDHAKQFKRLYMHMKNTVDHSRVFRPTILYVWGEPGVGKTESAIHIANMFVQNYCPNVADKIYVRNVATAHWDGYFGQPVVMYHDADIIDAATLYEEVMSLHDGNRTMLPMASNDNVQVGIKGTFFSSQLIIITSNKDPKVVKPKDIDHGALLRRFDLIMRVYNQHNMNCEDIGFNPEDNLYDIYKLGVHKTNKGQFEEKKLKSSTYDDYLLNLLIYLNACRNSCIKDKKRVANAKYPTLAAAKIKEEAHGYIAKYLPSWYTSDITNTDLVNVKNKFGFATAWSAIDAEGRDSIFRHWGKTHYLDWRCYPATKENINVYKARDLGQGKRLTNEHIGLDIIISREKGYTSTCADKVDLGDAWLKLRANTDMWNNPLEIRDLIVIARDSLYTICEDESCVVCKEHQEPWYVRHKYLLMALAGIAGACVVAGAAYYVYNKYGEQAQSTPYDPERKGVNVRKQYDTSSKPGVPNGPETTQYLMADVREDIVEHLTAVISFKVGDIPQVLRCIVPGANYVIMPRHYWTKVLKEISKYTKELDVNILRGDSVYHDKLLLDTYICPSDLEEQDLCSMQLSYLNMRRRISHFVSAASSGNLLAANYVDGTILGRSLMTSGPTRRIETRFTPCTRETYKESEPILSSTAKYKVVGWTFPRTLFEGDCGCLAYASSVTANTGYIMGMYVGTIGDRGRIQLLSQEYLEKLMPKLWKETTHVETLLQLDEFQQPRFQFKEEFKPVVEGRLSAKTSIHGAKLSDILPSPLHPKKVGEDVPWNEDLKEPVIMSVEDPRFKEKGFLISPLRNAVSFQGTEEAFPRKHLDKSLQLMDQMFRSLEPPMHCGVITLEETVNGIDGREYVKALEISTSPGAPYVSYRKLPGREDFLQKIGDKKCLVDSDVVRCYNERLESYRSDMPYPTYWVDCGKSETLKPSKINQNEMRLFNIAMLDHLLLTKQYFSAFMEWFYINRIDGFWAPGINIRSKECSRLMQKLLEKGETIWDLDYAKWDKTLPDQLGQDIVKIINKWYKINDPNWKKEDDLIRKHCINSIVDRMHVVADCVYHTRFGNTSGNILTVIINCLLNLRLVFLFIINHYDQLGLVNQLDFLTIWRCIYITTYGDDILFSVSKNWTWFDGEKYASFVERYKMKVTPGDKSDKIRPGTLSSVAFLKCKFMRVPDSNIWYPLLAKGSINSCLAWMKKPKLAMTEEDIVLAEINSALEWLVFYGKSVFNVYRKAILQHAPRRICGRIFSAREILENLDYDSADLSALSVHLGFKMRVY